MNELTFPLYDACVGVESQQGLQRMLKHTTMSDKQAVLAVGIRSELLRTLIRKRARAPPFHLRSLV